jgi:hypothetical protein
VAVSSAPNKEAVARRHAEGCPRKRSSPDGTIAR